MIDTVTQNSVYSPVQCRDRRRAPRSPVRSPYTGTNTMNLPLSPSRSSPEKLTLHKRAANNTPPSKAHRNKVLSPHKTPPTQTKSSHVTSTANSESRNKSLSRSRSSTKLTTFPRARTTVNTASKLSPPLSPKRKAHPYPGSPTKIKACNKHPAPILPPFKDTREKDKRQIAKLEAALAKIEQDKDTTVIAIKKGCKDEKKELKSRLKAFKEQQNGDALTELQLTESHKSIDAFRAENAKIRERNTTMRQNIENLKINNQRLEQNQNKSSEYFTTLQLHHKMVSDDHTKLTLQLEELDKQVQELREDLDEETTKARIEHATSNKYQSTLRSISEMVSESSDLHLFETISEILECLEA